MPAKDLLEGLDKEQSRAVTLKSNGAVSAGAGSGKTKVLASRYAWLVMERKLKPEEILTLTFTNKAVSEMYSRIYRYLKEQADIKSGAPDAGNERAAAALDEFHKARISTLDSFSSGIARTAAPRYGISPDFSSDETALRDLARGDALTFVLDNREAPAIRQLLVDHKIKKLAEEIFAQAVLRHSPISGPLELDKNLLIQKEAIVKVWREKVRLADEISGRIVDALRTLADLKKSISLTESLGELLLKGPLPSLPDIAPLLETGGPLENAGWDAALPRPEIRRQIKKYFDFYSVLVASRLPGRYNEVFTPVVEYFRLLKGKDGGGLYHELESIANYALNFGLCSGIFELLKKFQDEFNAKKRKTGFLSFNDIARLAVDALRDHPDIRNVYKDSIKMIMIDEFQDNNALQRDLIYLLAENPERTEKGVPAPADLEKDRLFFVGDEKQSIYRFRGADVAVFRSLGKDLSEQEDGLEKREQYEGGSIELKHNYRSRPGLIAVFNRIFGGLDENSAEETGNAEGVFLPPGPGVPGYEAVYNRIYPPPRPEENNTGSGDKKLDKHPGENNAGTENKKTDKNQDKGALAHFCFLNGEELPDDDEEGIKSQDIEAAFIAGKIREMVTNREKIPKRKDNRTEWAECTWEDFAVLERAYTHQSSIEKYFREFGVPYTTDRPSGLFNDAPILDIRSFLRLIVYPEDRIAYAALIRSPFMRLGDLTLSICLLNKNPEPFAEENEELIPGEDLQLYRQARERYRNLREASRELTVTELLTKLWFEEGYRYETLWSESAQVYESLFDLFFSIASDIDKRGKSLADFIEYLEDVMKREEKPDDKDIPAEGEAGVKIMSIHKSKGLEFPVVFIFDCAHSGNIRAPSGLTSYHEKYGLILNIPQAEELPLGGNYFRTLLKEEEKAKDIAELRRLLYVAMTRAEYRLFLTFTLPRQTKEEKKSWDMTDEKFSRETIRKRLIQLDEKQEGSRDTFLTLLAGILPDCPPSLCSPEIIPAALSGIKRLAAYAPGNADGEKAKPGLSQRETALAAEVFYEKAELLPAGEAGPVSLDASKLRYERLKTAEGIPAEKDTPAEAKGAEKFSGALDGLLEKAGISPADFGSLVHAVLEGRLNGRPAVIPEKIRSRADEEKTLQKLTAEAEVLADRFLASELGKRWAGVSQRESEFSVITSVTAGGKPIAIMGKIDLLFVEEDTVVVVDFKTDRIENPEDHYGQLAAYKRAAEDIFGKPVSAWLFYLRSGRAVAITEQIQNVSLEELAGAALAASS